ncbi:MAG: tetratricopeptide repeat protein [Phycisphaerae bacterium]
MRPITTLVRILPLVLLAAAAPAPAPSAAEATAPAKSRRTVFAVPLENETREEQYDPAAAGLGDLVAVLLAEQDHITVVERQRLLALTAEQAVSLKGLTGQEYALAAGKLLEADTVLTGRLFLVQGKLTAGLQAIDIASERVAAAGQTAFRPVDLMETAIGLARGLGKGMALPLPEIDPAKLDASPVASLHFAKAISHYYAGNMDAAIMQFMRTMDLDPDYVEAHYWCGMAHDRLKEPAHAAIEWEKYLQRCPDSDRAAAVRKLLGEARAGEKQSGIPRLGPGATEEGASPAAAEEAEPETPDETMTDEEKSRLRAHSDLQLGKMFEKAGKHDAARRVYEKLIERFPGTDAAREAAERLKALKEAAKPSGK